MKCIAIIYTVHFILYILVHEMFGTKYRIISLDCIKDIILIISWADAMISGLSLPWHYVYTTVVSHIYTYDRAQNILNFVQQLQKLIL